MSFKQSKIQLNNKRLTLTGVSSLESYYASSAVLWHKILIKILEYYTSPKNRDKKTTERIFFQNSFLVRELANPNMVKETEHKHLVNSVQKALKVLRDLGSIETFYKGTGGELVPYEDNMHGGLTERVIVPNLNVCMELLRVLPGTQEYNTLKAKSRERRFAKNCPLKAELDFLFDSIIETKVYDLNERKRAYNAYLSLQLQLDYTSMSLKASNDISEDDLDKLLALGNILVFSDSIPTEPPGYKEI